MDKRLTDIYRWIHPKNPRPEFWSPDARPEVRELLDVMRQYRHHDDNIFTVQFATPCNGILSADITPPGKETNEDAESKSVHNVNTPLMAGKECSGIPTVPNRQSLTRH